MALQCTFAKISTCQNYSEKRKNLSSVKFYTTVIFGFYSPVGQARTKSWRDDRNMPKIEGNKTIPLTKEKESIV